MGLGSATTILLFVAGAVGLAALIFLELRVREPLVDMRLMAVRGVWTTNLTALLVGFAMFGTFLLIPMLLELPVVTGYGFGKSVTQAGMLLLPLAGAMLVAGVVSGLLDRRHGPKIAARPPWPRPPWSRSPPRWWPPLASPCSCQPPIATPQAGDATGLGLIDRYVEQRSWRRGRS